MSWNNKLIVCLLYDLFDMTLGRALFIVPFSGEIVGCIFLNLMFGSSGFFYGLEALDPTEQIDGFIPMATLIALRHKPSEPA